MWRGWRATAAARRAAPVTAGVVLRHVQDAHALAFDHFGAGVGDDVELADAGADFLDVALELFDQSA